MAIRKSLSLEDGNLQNRSIINSRSRDFKDIDLLFKPKPSGDIYKKTDAAAVKQSVLNIVLTNFYEKPFRPFFGSNIRAQLFELNDQNSNTIIKNIIRTAIKNYEPRVNIIDIEVNARQDSNEVSVKLVFNIKNSTTELTVQTYISRLR